MMGLREKKARNCLGGLNVISLPKWLGSTPSLASASELNRNYQASSSARYECCLEPQRRFGVDDHRY
jgi:hypothetical protein